MKLYHGTNYSSALNIARIGIKLKYSKPYLDFGAGFYTTPSYKHAAIMALRVTDKFNMRHKTREAPYIVELSFDSRGIMLNIASYPRHGQKWGEFVLNNRLTDDVLKEYNIIEHNRDCKYDVCYGEIADGSIANIAYQVNNGIILPYDVDYNKFLKDNGNVYPQQYSFHTEKAISSISVLSCGEVNNKDNYLKLIGR